MNIENQIKKIDELVRKGNKASYKLALDKITNLQKIEHVSSLEFSENGYPDEDYIIGGEGYLYDEHQEKMYSLNPHIKNEEELCEI